MENKDRKRLSANMYIVPKDYCDCETCVALKELGYIGQGRCYYDLDKDKNQLRHFGIQVLTTMSAEALNFVLAVHLYDAQKWLREERGMLLQPTYLELSDKWICVIRDKNKRYGYSAQKQKNYEEALLEGIKGAIKLLKECDNTED